MTEHAATGHAAAGQAPAGHAAFGHAAAGHAAFGHAAVQGKAVYHIPGMFEFYDLYRVFLPLYREHPEFFYEWCAIGSVYGAPEGCLWGGGRTGSGRADSKEVLALLAEYGISARLTFSNSLLRPEHLSDRQCNALCALFERGGGIMPNGIMPNGVMPNGVIVHSELLTDYLRRTYPGLYLVSSTTKVLTDFADFESELNRAEFAYVVPDFRLNRSLAQLETLSLSQKNKVEFLCNECCSPGCKDRKACYESVSRKNLGLDGPEHFCAAPEGALGYRFSKAMENQFFIGIRQIKEQFLPMGFTNFKIEGRGLGSALILEFLLYYMVRPEYQLHVREAIYLDSMLDLF